MPKFSLFAFFFTINLLLFLQWKTRCLFAPRSVKNFLPHKGHSHTTSHCLMISTTINTSPCFFIAMLPPVSTSCCFICNGYCNGFIINFLNKITHGNFRASICFTVNIAAIRTCFYRWSIYCQFNSPRII